MRHCFALIYLLASSPVLAQPPQMFGPRCVYNQGPDCVPPLAQPAQPQSRMAICWSSEIPNTDTVLLTSPFETWKTDEQVASGLAAIYAPRATLDFSCYFGRWDHYADDYSQVINTLKSNGYKIQPIQDRVR